MNHPNLPRTVLFAFATLIICLLFAGSSNPAAAAIIFDDEEPKKELTIKDIMDQAHKQGLVKKVATDKATEAETKTLHELYTKLAKLSPPRGDKASWDTKTKALVDAAKAAVDKDATFKAKLKAATKCADCHKLHK